MYGTADAPAHRGIWAPPIATYGLAELAYLGSFTLVIHTPHTCLFCLRLLSSCAHAYLARLICVS